MKIKIKKNGFVFDKNFNINIDDKTRLISIFAPNGCGKTTICKQLLEDDNFYLVNNDILQNESDISFNAFFEKIFNDGNKEQTNIFNFFDKEIDEFKLEFLTNKNVVEQYKLIKNCLDDDLNNIENEIKILEQLDKLISNLDDKKVKLNSKLINIEYLSKATGLTLEKLNDYEILKEIYNKKREHRFGYKLNDSDEHYVDLTEEIKKDLLSNNSNITYEEYAFYDFIIKNKLQLNQINFNTKKMISKFSNDDISPLLEKLNQKKIILTNKRKFQNKLEIFQTKADKLLNYINDIINKINSFFNIEILEWKVNLNNIKDITEKIKPIFIQDGIPNDELLASEGEEKIIKSIAYFLTIESGKIIIADDIFNSLDNNHIDELLTFLFNKDSFIKNNKFIFLTHNFEIFRNISFAQNAKRNFLF